MSSIWKGGIFIERTIGFAIIGCGTISSWHAGAIAKIPEARLVAVSDVVEKAARQMGEKFNVDWYTDYRRILERSDVEAVSVCTPSGMRRDIAVEAASSGKHLIVEKPIEVTLQRADAIIEACRKSGVKLSAIFQTRFFDGIQRIKKAVAKARFGELVLGDAYIKWYRSQEYYQRGTWRGTWKYEGGGVLMTQGIHSVDLLRWVMGPVKSVQAKMGTISHKGIEVEDTVVAALRYTNGALGVIEASTGVYPGYPAQVQVHGSKGSAILEGEKIVEWNIEGEEAFAEEVKDSQVKMTASDPTGFSIEGHYRQYCDIVNAIRENREPLVNGEEGRKALELILAIYESAKSGKEVRFTDSSS